MKRINCALGIGLLLFPLLSFGGGENPPMGARSLGLGHASAALRDEWALFSNVAGIHSIKNRSAMATYHNHYGISSLNQVGFGVIFPYKETVWGTAFYRLGDSYYNEINAGLGVAHRIRNVSLGLKINYHQITIQEVGVKRNFIIEFGGLAEITEKIFFGAHIYNLNQAKVNKEEKEYIPIIMKAGLAYHPFEKLILTLETEKQLEFKPVLKAGLEYSIIEKIRLRAGCSFYPFLNYLGAGFKDKKISVDYALTRHPVLGISQQFSLTYTFLKNHEK